MYMEVQLLASKDFWHALHNLRIGFNIKHGTSVKKNQVNCQAIKILSFNELIVSIYLIS